MPDFPLSTHLRSPSNVIFRNNPYPQLQIHPKLSIHELLQFLRVGGEQFATHLDVLFHPYLVTYFLDF